MALKTLDELRDNIASTIRETQISSLIDTFINLTLQEIWQFHPWTFTKRKTTFSTVASQEDYMLDEEVDRITMLRQTASPSKLLYLPDNIFYELNPDPSSDSTGNPQFYRLWEERGFSTNLSADGTIYIKSSSASDTSSFKVVVVGRDSDGEVLSEEMSLNGITAVTSSTTWDADGLMQVSKSAKTTGKITIYATTADTVLSKISAEESSPRFKKISLYPIPSSVITIYVEYCERLRLLVNDADVPQIDHKWNWVLREGALSKAWEYKQNEALSLNHRQIFQQGLLLMRSQDMSNLDYVPVLQPRLGNYRTVIRTSDASGTSAPTYVLAYS